MIIERNYSKYVISAEESITSAINKIIDFEGSTIIALDSNGVMEGLFTKGDFLRWSVKQETIDLSQPISLLLNKNFIYATTDDEPEKIKTLLNKKVKLIPILDPQKRPKGIARLKMINEGVQIGNFTISNQHSVFAIAEIGINHNGSVEIGKQLIDACVEANVDCAKFQMRNMEALYVNAGNANDDSENLGSQYTLDVLSRSKLTNEEMFELFDYCKEKGIMPLCTPWDTVSLATLESYGMQAYKVASADLTNHDLLVAMAMTSKPIICSTGMSTEKEILEAIEIFQRFGSPYVLLQCNSTYPAPFKDINLKYMSRLHELGECPIGYSGHERGYHVSTAAVAMGADVIEKHITLDRSMQGNDHKVSLEPDEFKAMIVQIREIEDSLGGGAKRISQGELMNRVTLAKSLIIKQDLKKGKIITADLLDVKSPGRGLQPNHKNQLIGMKAKHDFKAGDFFYATDIQDGDEEIVTPRPYRIRRPWGVPVRWYDFKKIASQSNLDFLEFHLSFKDMEQDLNKIFDNDKVYDLDFTVHSPDTFASDHLLSPSHPNKEHRERSTRELQRVVDLTNALKPHFKHATKPFIITSMGGFTRDRLLHPSERKARYEQLAESLSQIDQTGVEIIPQTLPPFPWYFGGQLYLNLFIDPYDTVEFCETYGYRLCLDISHAKLACNHFKWSWEKYLSLTGPYAAHLHIADSEGVDGEGLQINEGEIDFVALGRALDSSCPDAWFIPEIWQGHENDGEGFWKAMERLEGLY